MLNTWDFSVNPVIDFMLVYGAPIAAIFFLLGLNYFKNSLKNNVAALKLGLSYFGVFHVN